MAGMMRGALGVGRGLGVLAVLAMALLPRPGSAQSLDRVDELMREGRVEDARAALLAWTDANPRPGREDRQRGLWLRGVLTLDPAQAEVIYRQLVLEYPGGAYTDQALLRLGTAAALAGDAAEAEANFRTLERDYPASPHRAEAVAWLERRAAAPEDAAGRPPEGVVPPRSDREPGQVPRGAEARPAAAGDFTAQAGAFSSLERAQALAAEIREAGFDPRVVRAGASELFRVRVGRFPTADEARALAARLQAAGFEAGMATDVSQERPAG